MKLSKNVSAGALVAVFALVLIGPSTAFAATSPSLGTAESFSVLAQTGITGTATLITGNVGNPDGTQITALTTAMVNPGTIQSNGGGPSEGTIGANVMTDLTAAYGFLNTGGDNATCTKASDGSTGTDAGVIELGGKSLVPGVYCTSGSFQITAATGPLTLVGTTGTWIFKSATTIDPLLNSVVTGGDPCNVWWRAGSAANIGNNASLIGTFIAHTGITFGTGVTLNGRALAEGANVTLNSGATISGPTCAVAASGGTPNPANITVVKTVVNDSGGTKTIADFPLFVNSTPVVSGIINSFPAPALVYTVTETGNANYTQSFSGACDSNGRLTLSPGDNKICIITNNDIGTPAPVVPPLIDVVKTASPLSLPAGPGSVVYSYTLRNIGTVPVTDITMVGDTCSPIVLASGDTNADNKLQVNETWVYRCTQTLSATHTNTVVATGWANGISATDIASATVVVGLPIVPPLIHVVKVPSTFTLLSPGGAVTYTYTVTNPGTVPLSNVTITDDKCTGLPGRVVGHSGDLNSNNLLDPNEKWTFTCKTNLTKTTTNVGTATGSANGMTATDLALATVVVASPKLPNTGLPPRTETPWGTVLFVGVLTLLSASLIVTLKKHAA